MKQGAEQQYVANAEAPQPNIQMTVAPFQLICPGSNSDSSLPIISCLLLTASNNRLPDKLEAQSKPMQAYVARAIHAGHA